MLLQASDLLCAGLQGEESRGRQLKRGPTSIFVHLDGVVENKTKGERRTAWRGENQRQIRLAATKESCQREKDKIWKGEKNEGTEGRNIFTLNDAAIGGEQNPPIHTYTPTLQETGALQNHAT